MNPWETYYASDEPLFRVGQVPVYVTTLMVAFQALAMIFFAIIGHGSPLIPEFIYNAAAILSQGKLWTLVTYAFVDEISFWSALGLVFFYLFGIRVEQRIGTRRYLTLLILLIIGPSLFLTLIGAVAGDPFGTPKVPRRMLGWIAGPIPYWSFSNVRLSVLIAFIWLNSEALFWPGVKGKWFGMFFVAVSTLQYLGDRWWAFFWMAWFSLLITYIFLRRKAGLPMQFAGIEEAILNILPKRRPKGYRSSKRKLKVVKKRKGGRNVTYESKLAPKVDAMSSSAPVASIDHLLEKISKEGISSLSDAEREQLKSASDQLGDANDQLSGDDKPSS